MIDLDSAMKRIEKRTLFTDECHICSYSTGSHGYVQIWNGETNTLAHRIVWEFNNGPIPEGLTVDHMCHNRICVNINHLRLLSNNDNSSDNGQVKIYEADQPPCRKGHARIKTMSGQIYCRICKAAKKRENRLAKNV